MTLSSPCGTGVIRPTQGCCGTCAWLAKSIKPDGSSAQPKYAVYDETEPYFREHPSGDFFFVPVFYNAYMQGHLTCLRRVAVLDKEADDEGLRTGSPGTPSWSAVIWKDRKCPMWSKYEPGVAPREHLAEARAQQFETQLSSIATRLTIVAILVGAAIGLLQLLVMTPDAVGCQAVKNVLGLFGALNWLACK
jgi:hypothetical protein